MIILTGRRDAWPPANQNGVFQRYFFLSQSEKSPESGMFTCDPTNKCIMPSSRERHKGIIGRGHDLRLSLHKSWVEQVSMDIIFVKFGNDSIITNDVKKSVNTTWTWPLLSKTLNQSWCSNSSWVVQERPVRNPWRESCMKLITWLIMDLYTILSWHLPLIVTSEMPL